MLTRKASAPHKEKRQYCPLYLIVKWVLASKKSLQLFIINAYNLYPLYYRIRLIRNERLEMPSDFDNELCKWAFECKYTWRVIQHGIDTATEIIHYGS
jgi:hypothetical protein